MSWDVVIFKNKIDLADKNVRPDPIGDIDTIIEELLIFNQT